ncbi:DUF7684 family protein [Marinobacter sp. GH_1]|jgi:hypothetical protein|uniref:DUF7684 family protein n=2 Tax=unclassified Marinobacter TaxID=83889 RepID=UPI0012A84CB0|nr:hypothetical protein FIV08_11380 [Marinobacter sp. THAF197a]QFT51214.1 hypothetical protein FIU96_11290 [Marinobacter sp. THAF39]
MKPRKVILATNSPYSEQYEPLLEELFNRRIELFCAWGTHCEQWESAMDVFVTDPDRIGEHHITTTSHADESLENVQNMASMWVVEGGGSNDVEIIRL